jgi:sec-independent protein translocase protein TatA
MLLLNLLNMGTAQQAGWFGGYEVILIVVVILLLVGGKKIPELMRGIGKGVKEFKGGISDDGNNKKESESANTANKETSDK